MVDAFQAACQGFGFRLADIALVKCDLALQVVQLDRVGIGYGQRADARGGEIGQGGGANPPQPTTKICAAESFCCPSMPISSKDVAAVPQQECVVVVVFGRGHDDVRKKQLRAIVTPPSGGVQLQTAFRDMSG